MSGRTVAIGFYWRNPVELVRVHIEIISSSVGAQSVAALCPPDSASSQV
jgi:hypothetical protein